MRLSALAGRAVLVTVAVGTSGCVAPGDATETCLSWVSYATPVDALESSELVVSARVIERDGTEPLYGVDAHAWTVTTNGAEPWRGDAGSGTLRVISTPVTCEARSAYPGDDPLDTDDSLVLFLTRDRAGDDWRTLTPRQGTLSTSGDLPSAWPVAPQSSDS